MESGKPRHRRTRAWQGMWRIMKRDSISQKRKGKDSMPLLKNDKRELTIVGVEKAEVVNDFASVFAGSQASHITQVSEPPGQLHPGLHQNWSDQQAERVDSPSLHPT